MNEDLITLLYGDDCEPLFDGELVLTKDNEYGVVVSRIVRCTGELLTDMKVLSLAPILDNNEAIGYFLINEEIYDKMYNSFFRITGMGAMIQYKTISRQPIYINVPILNRDCTITAGRTLILPCKVLYPSVELRYKNKKYIGKFSAESHELESLAKAGQ